MTNIPLFSFLRTTAYYYSYLGSLVKNYKKSLLYVIIGYMHVWTTHCVYPVRQKIEDTFKFIDTILLEELCELPTV